MARSKAQRSIILQELEPVGEETEATCQQAACLQSAPHTMCVRRAHVSREHSSLGRVSVHQPPARTSQLLSPPAPASPPSRGSTQGLGAGLSQHEGFATGAFIVQEVMLPALRQAELSKSARSWPPPPGAHPRSLCPQMLLLMYSSIPRATWGKCQNIVLPGISCSHQCVDKHEGKGMTTVWKMPETSLAHGPQCPPGTFCRPPHLCGIRWPRSAGHRSGGPPNS